MRQLVRSDRLPRIKIRPVVTRHPFISLLMVLQVSVCPFLGCDECKGDLSSQSVVAAAACRYCQQDSSSECPEPRGSHDCPTDCGSCNCFCAGTVQSESVKCPELAMSGLNDAWLDEANSPVQLQLAAANSPFGLSLLSPSISRGRSVCTLTERWLL